jgi:hypothetical protein
MKFGRTACEATLLVVLLLSLSSCANSQAVSPITPALDRPTFLYFYTDG